MREMRARGPYREALAQREFRVLFAAWSVSITGSVVSAVALTVLVFERTRSPLLSSLTFALGFVPYIFGGTLLSGVVDRIAPRRLLVACDLASTALVGSMALPRAPVAVLLVLLAANSVLTSLSNGARGGLVRSVVPEESYVPARSLMRIAAQTAQFGGNAVGGALLVLLTPRGAILVDAASFLASAGLMRIGLRVHPIIATSSGAPLFRDSLRGVRSVLSDARLRRLLLLGWLVPMFSVAPEAVAAPYVAGKAGSAALVGWWLAAMPAGTIIGDLLGVWRLSAERRLQIVSVMAAASFVPYLVFAGHPMLSVAIPLLFVAGLCSLYALGLDALVRQAASEEVFARMMTVNTAGLMTLQGLGFALAGAVAEFVGPARAIAIAGACGIISVALLRPRRIERGDAIAETPALQRG